MKIRNGRHDPAEVSVADEISRHQLQSAGTTDLKRHKKRESDLIMYYHESCASKALSEGATGPGLFAAITISTRDHCRERTTSPIEQEDMTSLMLVRKQ